MTPAAIILDERGLGHFYDLYCALQVCLLTLILL